MHPEFVELLPFVFAGILLGTFLPLGNDFPPGRGRRPPPFIGAQRPPPGVVFENANLSTPFGLLVRCMASLWDAVGTLYALSTTLHNGDTHFPEASAMIVDARAKLLAAARTQGWAGLAGVSMDSLSMVGTLRGPDGSLTAQDEYHYIRRYIVYALMDIYSRRDDAMFSPAVLNSFAASFARTGHVAIPSVAETFELDDDDIHFLISSTVAIVDLVIALISREENEPDIRAAFRRFAEDPTSWVGFTHSAYPGLVPSVQQIVQQTHRHPRGSSRILTVGPPRFPAQGNGIDPAGASLPGTTLTSLKNPFVNYEGATVFDVEPGTGTVMLCDEEIEYLAALFIAALIRFHANNGAPALAFKRDI